MLGTRVFSPILLLAVAFRPIYAQTNTSLSNSYSPGAIPYGAILGATDDTGVTGQPFLAEINARKVRSQPGGKQIVYESHGLLARDSEGRVHREQLPSPRVANAGGASTFVTHSVTISDPVAMIQLRWDDHMNEVLHTNGVSQSPLPKHPPGGKPQALDACEREHRNTRSYPNGETQERTLKVIGQPTRILLLIPPFFSSHLERASDHLRSRRLLILDFTSLITHTVLTSWQVAERSDSRHAEDHASAFNRHI